MQPRNRTGNAGIFVSYRHDDSGHAAERLADGLRHCFGNDQVFLDIASINLGVDFTHAIRQALDTCAAAIIVIGRQWLSALDSAGRRRLEIADDWVRYEVEESLRRGYVRVIPVLVDDAMMPRADELPESLRPLSAHQAARLTFQRWSDDVAHLVEQLQELIDEHNEFSGDAIEERLVAGFRGIELLYIEGLRVSASYPIAIDKDIDVWSIKVNNWRDRVTSTLCGLREEFLSVCPEAVFMGLRGADRKRYFDAQVEQLGEILARLKTTAGVDPRT